MAFHHNNLEVNIFHHEIQINYERIPGLALYKEHQQEAVALLDGHVVSEVMHKQIEIIPGNMTIDKVIERSGDHLHSAVYAIEHNQAIEGFITSREILKVHKEERNTIRTAQIMVPVWWWAPVQPGTDLHTVLNQMEKEEISEVLVVEEGKFLGMVSYHDILEFIDYLKSNKN